MNGTEGRSTSELESVAGAEPTDSGGPVPGAEGGEYDAFVSYSRADSEFILGYLRPALREHGHEAWVDRDITGGADWQDRVKRGIEGCKAFVFVVSPAAIGSQACLDELHDAVSLHKLIIPLILKEPDLDSMPVELARKEWVFWREDAASEFLAKLVTALETDLERRDVHTRLAGRAREWLDSGKNSSYLLRSADLRGAEAWQGRQEGHRERPTAEQSEFIARSRQAATRRQRRLIGGLSFALVVTIAAVVVALVQRQSAVNSQHAAQSRALAAEAGQQLNSDPELATLLALRAVRTGATPGALLALRQAIGADQLTRILPRQLGAVRAVLFDPNNPKYLAGVAASGAVGVWDVETGRLIDHHSRILPRTGEVLPADVAFSPRADAVVTGGKRGIHAWTVLSHKVNTLRTPLKGHDAAVNAVAINKLLAAGTFGGEVVLWSPKRVSHPAVWHDQRGSVNSLAFSPDGNELLARFDNGAAYLLDVHRARRPVVLASSGTRRVTNYGVGDIADIAAASAFSPDGTRVAVAEPRLVRLWTASGRVVATLSLGDALDPASGHSSPTDAAFSPDSALLAVSYESGEVGVYNAHTGALVDEIAASIAEAPSVGWVAHDFLAVATSYGVTKVFDPVTGSQVGVLGDGPTFTGSLATNSTGTQLATADFNGRVRLWNAFPGQALFRTSSLFTGLTPDGRSLVTILGTRLVLRTRGRTASLGTLRHFRYYAPPTFSDDDRMIAIAQANGISLENLYSHKRVALADSRLSNFDSNAQRQSGSFDPDDSRFVAPVQSGRRGTIWDAGTGGVVGHLHTGKTTLDQTLYSPNGAQIAAAGRNGVAYLEPASGTGRVLILADPRNAGPVSDMAFSPNGRLLATATDSAHSQVRLWNTRTGRRVGRALTNGYGKFVRFSSDGRLLVTGHLDDGVLVVPVTRDGLASRATQTIPTPDAYDASFAPGHQLIVADLYSEPTVFDLSSGQVVERLGANRFQNGFSYVAGKVLSTSAGGSTLYACDACGSTKSLIRNADSLLVQRLTAAQSKRFITGN